MTAQAVANTLWAFANMKVELGSAHEPMMNALDRVAGEMNAQDVANTLWAAAELKLSVAAAEDTLLSAVIKQK